MKRNKYNTGRIISYTTSISASRFFSSSSSFLVTAEESMPSPVAFETKRELGPDSELSIDLVSLSCDSILFILACVKKGQVRVIIMQL